ncbi:MAG: hypothetical protein KDB71_11410 [Mycobacterium sp.]|nr:hypothetical protein [Mycobacterium sp.]
MRPAWLPGYLLLVVLWGSSYAVTEFAFTEFAPTADGLWRIGVLGTLTTTAQVGSVTAQLRMPSGVVAVLCSMTPLISVVFYWLMPCDSPEPRSSGWPHGNSGSAFRTSTSPKISAYRACVATKRPYNRSRSPISSA